MKNIDIDIVIADESLPKGHWKKDGVLAKHWISLPNGKNGQVECRLCPRHCRPRNGQFGFNGVRGVIDGKLYSFNYGKSVAATEEIIETEAVYHYAPGSRILSLGNVGCMMSCDFCQNWETSQVKHLNPSVVKHYTPEQIVETCLRTGINVISWTYNDPVVWHEFVVDTSKLAQKHGIKTLYKSAFYIEEEPVNELIECIDIFSISLKSMDEDFYRKITKAELKPVLERIKQVYRSGRHLELSQLVITDRNDNPEDLAKTVNWVIENLDSKIPLHFVGFHPAYKYMDVTRTPSEALYIAKKIATEKGIQHCYLGNLYEEGAANSCCANCGNILVSRFGLTSEIVGITKQNTCSECGNENDIKFPFNGVQRLKKGENFKIVRSKIFEWNEEVSSLHIEYIGDGVNSVQLISKVLGSEEESVYVIGGGISRVIISRSSKYDKAIELLWDKDCDINIYPVLDRAHFPVIEDLPTNLLGVNQRPD